MPGHVVAALRMWAGGVRDLALPPRCPACGTIIGTQGHFCAACWQRLTFLGPPWCAGCNVPLPDSRTDGALCATCLAAPPRHAGVRAAVGYGDVARTLALRLKYSGRTGDADVAARLMVRHLPNAASLLVAVPLHRWRLWSRGYNQAGLIVDALVRRTGITAAHDVIERHRSTPVLRDRSPRERRRAVQGAFRLRPGARARLAGAQVVLVDDVYTTGATTHACVAVLLAGGASQVTILAWARALAHE